MSQCAAREDHEDNSNEAEDDYIDPPVRKYLRPSGQKDIFRRKGRDELGGGIAGSMHHYRHPDTAARVVEEPGIEERPCRGGQHEDDESVNRKGSKQGREQRRQMPDAVQCAQDDRP